MKRAFVALFLTFVASQSSAQGQPPDVATLQRTVNTLQQQRNQILDALTVTEVRANGLQEELAAAKKKIEELEKQLKEVPAKKSE